MPGWIERSLRFRMLIVPVAVALMVAGILALRSAPVDVLPEFGLPTVQVQTENLGLSAAEVEQLVTVPLEQDLLNGVKGVDSIRSDTVAGLSSITLVFERGTDVLRARQLVAERLSQPHAFPSVGGAPQMIQPVSSTNRVLMIGLSSRQISPIQLSVLARWTVRPRLMGIPGVANVAIWGHRDRQLQVLVDPRRLRDRGVSLSDVVRTSGNAQLVSPLTYLNASTPGTGGFIDGPNQRLGVRHILPFGAPRDLAQVPIDNTSRRLGDVARVVEDHPPLIGDAVVGGRRAADDLLLVVEKLPGTNTLALTRRLDEALTEMRPGLTGVRIDATLFRPATFIERALGNLGLAALIASALALLALIAAFMRWRAVLIAAVAVPLSLVVAVWVLDLTGATLNALVVAGLLVALVLVVDDAVGDVENVTRRLREDRAAGRSTRAAEVVRDAAAEMRGPLAYATLIVLLVMLPVFFAGGLTGAYLHPLAVSYGLAVVASMAVALTVTPALTLLLLGGAGGEATSEPAAPARARVAFGAALQRFTRTPRPALFTLLGVLVAGAALIPLLGTALRPAFKDRELLVHWAATPSTSLAEMNRITARAAAELRGIPGVREVGGHVGRAITSDQIVGTGSGELWVTIEPSAAYDRTLGSVRRVVAGYPGLRGSVLTYEEDRSAGALSRGNRELVVRVFGQDLGVLQREAEDLRGLVGRVDGVQRPRVRAPVSQPTLQIEVRLPDARRYRVKPGDVRRAAATLVQGLDVGSFFEQQKVFQVVVRGVPAVRDSIDGVRGLLIDTDDGGHVRLGDVADVRIRPNLVDVRHDAVSRYMDVRADVRGRSLADVQAEVRSRIRRATFPFEYHAEVVAASEDAASPLGRVLGYGVAAAIGAFLLLQAAFGSWRIAGLVMATLPMALVGGLVVVAVMGGDLTLGALGGLAAVLALAVRNAVLLVSRLLSLQRADQVPLTAALVVRATQERFGPMLATAVVGAAALAPFAVMGDVAGNEIPHAIAAVVLGGLVTTMLLGAFVLPALYLHAAPRAAPRPAAGEDADPSPAESDLIPQS